MLEYYEKYENSPLIETHAKIDAVVETPLKLTLSEIGVCFAVFVFIIGWIPGYFALSAIVLAPLTGFILYWYRKTFPRQTFTHFLWTIGFLDTKKIGLEVPCLFKQKVSLGYFNLLLSFFKKRRRHMKFTG